MKLKAKISFNKRAKKKKSKIKNQKNKDRNEKQNIREIVIEELN